MSTCWIEIGHRCKRRYHGHKNSTSSTIDKGSDRDGRHCGLVLVGGIVVFVSTHVARDQMSLLKDDIATVKTNVATLTVPGNTVDDSIKRVEGKVDKFDDRLNKLLESITVLRNPSRASSAQIKRAVENAAIYKVPITRANLKLAAMTVIDRPEGWPTALSIPTVVSRMTTLYERIRPQIKERVGPREQLQNPKAHDIANWVEFHDLDVVLDPVSREEPKIGFLKPPLGLRAL